MMLSMLIVVLSLLMAVLVQCFFTSNNVHRCLIKGISTSMNMKFPSWLPEINPNRPNSIWPRKDQPKVDFYSEEKKLLLRTIAATRIRKTSSYESSGEGTMTDRQSILSCVSILETKYANRQKLSLGTSVVEDAMISPNQCADGLWSLIYSTKQSSTKVPSLFASSSSSLLSTWIGKISGELYKVFFRFAPLLAGGQDESRSANQNPIQGRISTKQSVTNKQIIDLINRKVTNVVTFENAFLTKLLGSKQTRSDKGVDSSNGSSGSSNGSAKIEIRVCYYLLSFCVLC